MTLFVEYCPNDEHKAAVMVAVTVVVAVCVSVTVVVAVMRWMSAIAGISEERYC